MLPELNDTYDEISDEAKLELVCALLQVFKDLRDQDINKISMGELLIMVGYDREDLDPDDFDFELDLSKADAAQLNENYLSSIMKDKLH